MRYLKFIVFSILMCLFINVYATPANDSFLDDNLYSCVIDAYNATFNDNKDTSYSIYPEKLIQIKTLDCSKYISKIEDLTGLNKMLGLTTLNLSGKTFTGGSLKLTNKKGTLKSSIVLPNSLKITDKTYRIEDSKIVKIVNDEVYPLRTGSTYVTMTGKVSGNTISEKYLVMVNGGTYSSNSKLSSLYLSKGEFSFDSDVKNYTAYVDKSVESVVVNATLSDKNASFVNGYGPRTVKLDVGSNKIEVKVKAQDDSVSTYTIDVIKSDGTDNNNKLINIELSVGKINFLPEVYNYNFSVDSNVNEIDVKGVSESTLAKVYVKDISGNEKEDKITSKLKVGTNKITLRVVSESSKEQTYTLTINREDYDSQDNYLKNITIEGYKLDFKRDQFKYNLTIRGKSKLNITPVLENTESTYVVEGNEKLVNNSIISIKVSDKEGSTREYQIKIIKNSIIDSNVLKFVFMGIEFIVIIALLIILISNKKNRPRKPKKVKTKVKKETVGQPRPIGSSTTCKVCGTVNDSRSKTCYVCGNKL